MDGRVKNMHEQDVVDRLDAQAQLESRQGNAQDRSSEVVSLRLTRGQLEALAEILMWTQDEGPVGEGWASARLVEWRCLVDEALG
jgi:hypothetical protein